jgi:hypothetical protein
MRKYIVAAVLIVASFGTLAGGFVKVTLPRGVSMQLPAGWRALSSERKDLIRLSVDSAMEISGYGDDPGKELNLIAANSSPASTYAAVRVDSLLPPSISPHDLSLATPQDFADLQKTVQPEMERLLPLQGNHLIGPISIGRENYSGYPALVTTYRRTGPKGPVVVKIIQIMTPQQEIKVNLSYRESEQAIWMPIIEKIRRSIVIANWP